MREDLTSTYVIGNPSSHHHIPWRIDTTQMSIRTGRKSAEQPRATSVSVLIFQTVGIVSIKFPSTLISVHAGNRRSMARPVIFTTISTNKI